MADARLPEVPGYRVTRAIGRGGMGEVYEAVRVAAGGFRKAVALKRLALDHVLDGRAVQRFFREARLSARLEHPHLVRVHDLLVVAGGPFLVMELLRGLSFAELVRRLAERGPLPWWLALSVAEQALEGLAYAHGLADDEGRPLGLVHRDLTPRNLFVCRDGTVKVLDLGLAKALHDVTPALTREGNLVGTLEFLSPEQARAGPVDWRSDLYQLGATLYWALGGAAPHVASTPAEVLARVLAGAPRPLAELRPDLPPPVTALVARAMAPDPDDRYPDAAAMRGAVREALAAAEDAGAAGLARIAGEVLGPPEPPAPDSSEELAPTGAAASPAAEIGGGRPAPSSPSRRRAIAALLLAAAAPAAFLAGRVTRPDPRPAARPSYERLTFRRGQLFRARFTPDQRQVVYSAAFAGGPVETFLALPGSPDVRSLGAGVEVLDVSAAGEMALLVRAEVQLGFVRRGTLARATLAGGAPRPELEDVQWAAWDGAGELALVRWRGDRTQLEYPQGRVLVETGAGWFGDIAVSPAGDVVAFLRHPLRNDDRGTVALVDRGGRVRDLGPEWSSLQGIAWRGGEIWFSAAARGSARSLHAVTPGGAVRLVESGPSNLGLYDVAADGRALLFTESMQAQIVAGRQGEAREIDLSVFDAGVATDISTDGRFALVGELGGDATRSEYVVYLRGTDGAPAVRLATGFAGSFSPDGSWALVNAPLRDRITLVPTGPGEPRVLALGGHVGVSLADFFPDGERVLFATLEGDQRLFAAPVAGGDPVEIDARGLRLRLSHPIAPDGRTLALTDPGDETLRLLPLGGGAPTPVPGAQPGETVLRWSADGRALFVTRFGELPLRVTRLDLASGRRDPWCELAPADRAGVSHVGIAGITPDGKAWVYTYGRRLSTLFLVSGLR